MSNTVLLTQNHSSAATSTCNPRIMNNLNMIAINQLKNPNFSIVVNSNGQPQTPSEAWDAMDKPMLQNYQLKSLENIGKSLFPGHTFNPKGGTIPIQRITTTYDSECPSLKPIGKQMAMIVLRRYGYQVAEKNNGIQYVKDPRGQINTIIKPEDK